VLSLWFSEDLVSVKHFLNGLYIRNFSSVNAITLIKTV
jgi:hypothetical protein